jgi:hypothetical protein
MRCVARPSACAMLAGSGKTLPLPEPPRGQLLVGSEHAESLGLRRYGDAWGRFKTMAQRVVGGDFAFELRWRWVVVVPMRQQWLLPAVVVTMETCCRPFCKAYKLLETACEVVGIYNWI